jgi:hypothetical protein
MKDREARADFAGAACLVARAKHDVCEKSHADKDNKRFASPKKWNSRFAKGYGAKQDPFWFRRG